MLETTWLTQSDGERIFVRKWLDQSTQQKGIVQIAHGMAEHGGRYQAFAEILTEQGYVVYAQDHRGHGMTGKEMGIMGHFADHDGFERAVDDIKEINDQIKANHPNLPIILFGHSMGSFLVRRYIQRYQTSFDGVVISGTSAGKGIIGKIGRLIAKLEIKRLGARTESKLMDQLSFGHFNKGYTEPKSWLSRDKDAVKTYNHDPLCGFISSAKFYDDLLYGIEKIHQRKEIAKVNRHLPILIISGDADPVGGFSKGVNQVVKSYQKHGSETLDIKLYEEARHELLFETNRDQVIEDLITWLDHTCTHSVNESD